MADKLTTTLSAQGVAAFGAEGEEFDPTRHEAVAHEGAGSDPVVATVARRGYQLGNRVLRTALVTVTNRAYDIKPVPEGDNTQRGREPGSGADHCAEHPAPQEQETPA